MGLDMGAVAAEGKLHTLHAQVQEFALDGSGSESDNGATCEDDAMGWEEIGGAMERTPTTALTDVSSNETAGQLALRGSGGKRPPEDCTRHQRFRKVCRLR